MNFCLNLIAVAGLGVVAGPIVSVVKSDLGDFSGALLPLRILLPGVLFFAGSRMISQRRQESSGNDHNP